MEIVGKRLIDVTSIDVEVRNEEVKQDRTDYGSLGDSHLRLSPLRQSSLVQNSLPPVAHVRTQPPLYVWMKIGGVEFIQQFVPLDDVESLRQVDT